MDRKKASTEKQAVKVFLCGPRPCCKFLSAHDLSSFELRKRFSFIYEVGYCSSICSFLQSFLGFFEVLRDRTRIFVKRSKIRANQEWRNIFFVDLGARLKQTFWRKTVPFFWQRKMFLKPKHVSNRHFTYSFVTFELKPFFQSSGTYLRAWKTYSTHFFARKFFGHVSNFSSPTWFSVLKLCEKLCFQNQFMYFPTNKTIYKSMREKLLIFSKFSHFDLIFLRENLSLKKFGQKVLFKNFLRMFWQPPKNDECTRKPQILIHPLVSFFISTRQKWELALAKDIFLQDVLFVGQKSIFFIYIWFLYLKVG